MACEQVGRYDYRQGEQLGQRYCEPKPRGANKMRQQDEARRHEYYSAQHHVGDGSCRLLATLIVAYEGDVEGEWQRTKPQQRQSRCGYSVGGVGRVQEYRCQYA